MVKPLLSGFLSILIAPAAQALAAHAAAHAEFGIDKCSGPDAFWRECFANRVWIRARALEQVVEQNLQKTCHIKPPSPCPLPCPWFPAPRTCKGGSSGRSACRLSHLPSLFSTRPAVFGQGIFIIIHILVFFIGPSFLSLFGRQVYCFFSPSPTSLLILPHQPQRGACRHRQWLFPPFARFFS